MEIYEMAEKVADEVVKCGWIRGTYRDDEGHVCLVGALNNVDLAMHDKEVFLLALHRHLDFCYGVESWNDEVAESQEQVVETLLALAKEYRPDEMRIDGNL